MIHGITRRRDSGLKGIRGIFRDLGAKKYTLERYSGMNKKDSLAYLNQIHLDVRGKLEILNYRWNFLTRDINDSEFS